MKTIRVFLSGVAVYFLVAILHACGGTVPTGAAVASSGTGGAATSSATGAGAGGMTNPVGDAYAEESGSRIKARWLNGDDGSKQFVGFYDSERKEYCAFLPMSDGHRHCVPLYSSIGNPRYSDAACVNEIYSMAPPIPGACVDDLYTIGQFYIYSVPASDACGYRFYGLVTAPVPQVTYIKSGMNCVSVPLLAGHSYFLKGPEILPSAFVAATLTTDP